MGHFCSYYVSSLLDIHIPFLPAIRSFAVSCNELMHLTNVTLQRLEPEVPTQVKRQGQAFGG